MKRLAVPSIIAIVVIAIVALAWRPWQSSVTASGNHGIFVEVAFHDDYDGYIGGETCGLTKPSDSTEDPMGEQVIVTTTSGDVAGTVDLFGFMDFRESYDSDPLIGSVGDEGYCVIKKELDLPESSFYTFSIENRYSWTISTSDLEAMDWHIQIALTAHD